MKFDYVIGNPPYQEEDGGAQASAKPVYHYFVEQAKQLSPGHISFIMPARWYAGGKGLDSFRDSMLSDEHISTLLDFPITSDCFPGQNIRGGVCIFLWDEEYNNKDNEVKVVNYINGEATISHRQLKYEDVDVFIRYAQAISILDKVSEYIETDNFSTFVSARKPFGLSTDFAKSDEYKDNVAGMVVPVVCYSKGMKKGYVERDNIKAHKEWIDRIKLITPRANNIGTELNDDNLNVYIVDKETVCTESYICIGGDLDLNKNQARNMVSYLQTKFARFMHSLAKSSQDATAKTYRFIPNQDFSIEWTDQQLYRKYGLTDEEIEFIETHVKPME